MVDLMIVAVLTVAVIAAVRYIYKAKKSGARCIGCSAGACHCCSAGKPGSCGGQCPNGKM